VSTFEDTSAPAVDEGEWVSIRASGSRPVAVVAVFVLALVTLPALALVVTFSALS
jgi:hypothetical protein